MSVASHFANQKGRAKILAGFSIALVILAVTGGMGLRALSAIVEDNAIVVQRTGVVQLAAEIELGFFQAGPRQTKETVDPAGTQLLALRGLEGAMDVRLNANKWLASGEEAQAKKTDVKF